MANKMIDTETPKAVAAPAGGATAGAAAIGVVFCLVVTLSVLGAIAIALGVGLGVGLSRNNGFTNNNNNNNAGAGAGGINPNCTVNGVLQCGCTSVTPITTGLTRISQSIDATPNSWPWVVSITTVVAANPVTRCTGFLVDARHVVTSTNCLVIPAAGLVAAQYRADDRFIISAGATAINAGDGTSIRSAATYSIQVPNTELNQFGITVIRLASLFTFSRTINRCCLPVQDATVAAGTQGIIAGWGVATTGQTQLSNVLRQAVVTTQGCNNQPDFASAFCTNRAPAAPQGCNGDDGAPFMTRSGITWTCAGMLELGNGCPADLESTNYYTFTGSFRTAIEAAVNF